MKQKKKSDPNIYQKILGILKGSDIYCEKCNHPMDLIPDRFVYDTYHGYEKRKYVCPKCNAVRYHGSQSIYTRRKISKTRESRGYPK